MKSEKPNFKLRILGAIFIVIIAFVALHLTVSQERKAGKDFETCIELMPYNYALDKAERTLFGFGDELTCYYKVPQKTCMATITPVTLKNDCITTITVPKEEIEPKEKVIEFDESCFWAGFESGYTDYGERVYEITPINLPYSDIPVPSDVNYKFSDAFSSHFYR